MAVSLPRRAPRRLEAPPPVSTPASSSDDVQLDLNGPVMFCVRDVQSGEVSILHGMQEVIVKDRQLVNRIVRAAQVRRAI